MGAGRRRLAQVMLVGLAIAALATACSGKTQNPVDPGGSSSLSCLADLPSYCCAEGGPANVCVGDFVAAQRCSAWPAGSNLMVYAAPCQGLTAIRVVNKTYSSFYVYDATATLVVVGDNAASPDPRTPAIECGAGPNGFSLPTACTRQWLGSAGAQACASGSAAPRSVCR